MELIDENSLKFIGLCAVLVTMGIGLFVMVSVSMAFYDAKVILDKLKDKYLDE